MQIRDTYRHKTLDRKTNNKNKAAKVKLRIKMENVQSNPLTSDSMVISQALRDRLSKLKSLHRQYIEIEMKFLREFFALEVEFQEKRQQFFEKRKCYINGADMDTSIDQITESIQNIHLDENQFLPSNGNKMEKCVPNFWLQALKNCFNDLTFIIINTKGFM